jgi:hypothetical protein
LLAVGKCGCPISERQLSLAETRLTVNPPGALAQAFSVVYSLMSPAACAGDNSGMTPPLAPRFLGSRAVITRSFARIHWQNLSNFDVLPLSFEDHSHYDRIVAGDVLKIPAGKEWL